MMAPFYEILKVLSDWLVKKGIKRNEAQKYITSLFVALSEDSVVNSKKHLKYLVSESQTPGGLNEQGVKELRRSGFYKSLEKSLTWLSGGQIGTGPFPNEIGGNGMALTIFAFFLTIFFN